MTIGEVVGTGKRFRQKGDSLWHDPIEDMDEVITERIDFRNLTWGQLASDNWEKEY